MPGRMVQARKTEHILTSYNWGRVRDLETLTAPAEMRAAWGPRPSAAATTSLTSASPLSLKSIHFSAPRERHNLRFSSPLSTDRREPQKAILYVYVKHTYGDDTETHCNGILYRWKMFEVRKRVKDEGPVYRDGPGRHLRRESRSSFRLGR